MRDLVEVAERVYNNNNRESADKKPIKTGKVSNRDLSKVLLANNIPDTEERTHQL